MVVFNRILSWGAYNFSFCTFAFCESFLGGADPDFRRSLRGMNNCEVLRTGGFSRKL